MTIQNRFQKFINSFCANSELRNSKRTITSRKTSYVKLFLLFANPVRVVLKINKLSILRSEQAQCKRHRVLQLSVLCLYTNAEKKIQLSRV